VVFTFVNTPHGPAPAIVCIYKSPEIEYDVHIMQPPWEPCADFRNV